jgi:hypothetical protein
MKRLNTAVSVFGRCNEGTQCRRRKEQFTENKSVPVLEEKTKSPHAHVNIERRANGDHGNASDICRL